MIDRHLDRIRAEEERSRAAVADAESRAAEIVERARREGEALLEETRAEAVDRERSSLAAAQRRAGETISTLRAENAKRLAALAVLARKNEEGAAEMIAKEFRGGA